MQRRCAGSNVITLRRDAKMSETLETIIVMIIFITALFMAPIILF